MSISNERKAELVAMAESEINSHEWYEWDGLIGCDETMTEKELAWLEKRCTVYVKVVPKS